MNSTISPYNIPKNFVYEVIDDNSISYENQKNIDYISAQMKENAIGDILPSPNPNNLILGPQNQNGSGKTYLQEFRIKINNKGFKVMDYNEINAIKKVFKKNNSKKDYLIICNNVLYKGCNGKIKKIY
jgi:hypothetical protein